ncbi:MAG: acetyl-CoA carboxylase biotin carboxylase subunit [Aquificae bacterium]|nr:acetyl-CoA carboxylase biotin carboxylase subunit [Aquificota bacterium]
MSQKYPTREIKKVVIANRGEIAVRAIRTCKELGIKTVAVYSEADKESLHVKLADEAICIGPPNPQESYLNIPAILSVADITGADAIYPGYGFLSENPKFAEIVEAAGLIFIGPRPETLKLIGNKVKAKSIAKKAGVPTIPGSSRRTTLEEALDIAHDIGYPVMLKAAAGGGGRGMRVVFSEKELREKFPLAQNEARISFGDDTIYIEKFLMRPKHIEVQILADEYGNVVPIGDRECSIQRRHQKVIEEAPAYSIDQETRKKLYEAAVKFAKAVNYRGAGTVEFLYDPESKEFYFIEMNGRIQVEHPVTEMVTGIDLVKWQFLIAQGYELDIKEPPTINGYALEMRINAEDPKTFAPSPGTVEKLILPGGFGVRVDTHLYQGYQVPPYYDSLLAKFIVWAPDREELIKRALRVIDETTIEGKGLKTNLEFHRFILQTKEFKEGKHHVKLLEELNY